VVDVSKLTIDDMFNSIARKGEYVVYYTYRSTTGLVYLKADDELGVYQELLKHIKEVYKDE